MQDRRGGISRRELIRAGSIIGSGLFFGSFLGLTGCGSPGTTPGGAAGGSEKMGGPVRWLSWSVYQNPQVLGSFKEAHGVAAQPINFEDNSEAFLKVKQGKGAQFDAVQSDGFWPVIYYENGLIEPLPVSEMSSTKTLAPQFRQFGPWRQPDERLLQYPNMWAVEPIVYRKSAVKPFTSAWDLWDPQYKGRIIQMDRPSEFIAAVGLWLGYKDPYKMTPEQLDQVRKKLLELKPSIKAFTASSADFVKAMAAGEGDLGFCPSQGNALRIKAAGGGDWGYIVPKEGTTAWVDGTMLVEEAQHRDAAIAWINHASNPESQYELVMATKYPTANEETVKMLKKNGEAELVEAMGMENFEMIENTVQLAPPNDIEAWTQVWNEFKA